jgi:hypothetical protein
VNSKTSTLERKGKYVIIISQKNEDMPFDIRHLPFIHYNNNKEGFEIFAKDIKAYLPSRGT